MFKNIYLSLFLFFQGKVIRILRTDVINKLFKKFGIETLPSAFVSNDKEELEEMSSMAGGNVQGAMMGRGAGKATSPFEDLDVEKENEDERKRSHTIKGDPLTEEDELVEQVLYYLLGQNGAI